ncbi:hypothetical protein EQG63_09470 [Flavobacterium amnicola]|uniref:YncE family protein n=1 Tax=Flavobacterium amnicola TaxID=2506422 RepID=A0A4V1N1R8_9FLAO|nr:DUF5074 domain-containing protein [Flavobacterium amnicola]RXR17705.1 hypothetical protein EQG63_09470 [Flavobacterium amnicola]
MKFIKITAFTLFTALFFTSCSNDDEMVTPQLQIPLGNYASGVLILNQGNFGTPNSTMSYVSDDLAKFQDNIFGIVNPDETLGDTGQDLGFYGDKAYIVVNNSNKIEIVNRYTMKHITSITVGLSNPRYIAFYKGKGYVTNWGDGGSDTDDFVAVINLTSNTVTSSIPVAEGPERIVVENDKLYVAHKGGYNFGNTVSMINPVNNAITPITVGDVPNSLVENNGTLYVMCEGKPSWSGSETGGKLVKINLSNNSTSSIAFATTSHPSNLVIDNDLMYYTEGSNIYKMNVTATSLPIDELFSTTAQGVYGVYSFAVKNSKIFVGDAVDYSSNGKVYIYSLSGVLKKDYTVGVIPAGFYFN